MFDALHRLLTGLDHPHRAAEQNDSAFALAVLLIDVARSGDNRVEDREEGVIERALARRFGLEGRGHSSRQGSRRRRASGDGPVSFHPKSRPGIHRVWYFECDKAPNGQPE
jgi:hypothetical protein